MYSEILFKYVVLKLYLSSVSFKYALGIISSCHPCPLGGRVLILATALAIRLSGFAL